MLDRSGDKNNWRVEVRSDTKAGWEIQADPASELFESVTKENVLSFESTISGPYSGAPFEYRILKSDKEVFKATGRARKPYSEPYHFVVFGDMGANLQGKKLAYQIYKNNPDFMVLAGDIVYNIGRLLPSIWKNSFPSITPSHPRLLPQPVLLFCRSTLSFAVIGNHDVAFGDKAGGVDLNKFQDNGMAFFKIWSEPLNGPLNDWHKGNAPKLLG